MPKAVQGRKKKWHLLEVVGRGDAGEVLSVQSELGLDFGVMKRPVQNVSGGTIVRQATQIENEGYILKELDGIDYRRGSLVIHTPKFIDESILGTSGTANLFMVSERVQGVSIDSLLKSLQRGETQFSQVLVLKVLVSLLNLLPKVHEKGILWNDVKMEHIFWHASEGRLSFIDWGNGMRFDPQKPDAIINPLVDYQQLITEGNLLLEQTTLDLAQDIGWPRDAANLSEGDITQLRFRLEFMESYLEMRSSEYRLTIDKMLQDVTEISVLQEAINMRVSLHKLGVVVQDILFLEAASKLIDKLIAGNDLVQAKQVARLITSNFADNNGENWQLLGYCLSIPELATHRVFHILSKAILSKDWELAMWTAQEINLEPEFPLDLTKLIVAMRKFVNISSATTIPISELLARLSELAGNPQSISVDIAVIDRLNLYKASLNQLIDGWSTLQPGQQLGDQFLQAREFLSDPVANFLGFQREQLAGVNHLLTLIREIYRNWESGDLKTCLKAVRQLFSLEPGALYLSQMATQINEVEQWIKQLTSGSEPKETGTQLATKLASQSLSLTELLGQPDWLARYRYIASTIANAEDITSLRHIALAESWPVPWLHYQTTHLDLPLVAANSSNLSYLQVETLQIFHLALRRSFPVKVALDRIRELLPGFHQGYTLMQQSAESSFSLLESTPERWPLEAFPSQDRSRVAEFYEVLEKVFSWKTRLQSGIPVTTNLSQPKSDWVILLDMGQTEQIWFSQILPLMTRIRQKQWQTLELPKNCVEPELLSKVVSNLVQIAQDWAKVSDQGIFRESSQEFIFLTEQAQASFFEFWQRLQKSELKPLCWLVEISQPFFSQINQSLLQVSRHFRAISRALEVVNTPHMARTKLAQNGAGDVIFSLVQLENLLQPPSRKRSVIRDWQKQYLDLLSDTDRDHILATIENVESIHPLLPWFNELAHRDADYFNTPDLQKW